MSEHWDFYFCMIDGEPSTVFLDLARREGAPDGRRPDCLRVRFDFLTQQENGFPTRDEATAVEPLEDAIVAGVCEALEAAFVGRTTGGGMRQLYFYANGHTGIERALEGLGERWPDYPLAVDVEHDPDWTIYLEHLYPTPRERERMANRELCTALEAEGDTGEVPRPVDHWCWFASPEDRATVAEAMAAQGFAVVATPDDENPVAPLRYGLHLRRTDPVWWQAIDEITDAFVDALEGMDAQYDGWESPVVRPDGG